MTAEADGFRRVLPQEITFADGIAVLAIGGTLASWSSDAIPAGAAKIVVTAVAVVAGTFVLVWPRLGGRWLVVDRAGVRITSGPAQREVLRIARGDLDSFRILQEDDLGLADSRGRVDFEDPTSTWTVTLVARDGREIRLSDPVAWADQADQLVSEVRDALGDPTIPVRHLTKTTL